MNSDLKRSRQECKINLCIYSYYHDFNCLVHVYVHVSMHFNYSLVIEHAFQFKRKT